MTGARGGRKTLSVEWLRWFSSTKVRPFRTAERTADAVESKVISWSSFNSSDLVVAGGIISQYTPSTLQTPDTPRVRTSTSLSVISACSWSNCFCSTASISSWESSGLVNGKASMKSEAALRRTTGLATFMARHRMGVYKRCSISSTPFWRLLTWKTFSTRRTALAVRRADAYTPHCIKSCKQSYSILMSTWPSATRQALK
mmetsp:Transcript_50826/g.99635  ORF Transcript_50826/g.99635 Transcript_50826/m.99635 type:complete len:201 (+) Transcript_50826:2428-3030(+)